MTGTTPLYGIRYPDSTSKARNLGAELAQMGADVERALVAASIPSVTPSPIMTAQTAAARDAYWGVPGNEAARVALQGLGAITIRNDTGVVERYYATYNAGTNPGGAQVAGWYPIAGKPTPGSAITYVGVYSAGTPAPKLTNRSSTLMLTGTVTSSVANFASGYLYSVATIPAASAPVTVRTFTCTANATAVAAVTIGTDGAIKMTLNTSFSGALLLSLDGISWQDKNL